MASLARDLERLGDAARFGDANDLRPQLFRIVEVADGCAFDAFEVDDFLAATWSAAAVERAQPAFA